jgi:MFS family permease
VQLAQATPPEQFAAANGLLSILMTGAGLVGPLLGGLVLVGAGAAPVFLLNGLSFAAVALVAARLLQPEKSTAAASLLAAEWERGSQPPPTAPTGYVWLLRQPELALFAGAALGVTVAIRGAIALFVVRSRDLDLGDAGPGYFYAAVALGAVIGGLFAGGGTHDRPTALRRAAGAMIACALALVGFGTFDATLGVLLALALAGLATNVYEVLGLTYFQHRLPTRLYGRFMSLFLLALGIGGIVGALAGPLVERSSSVRAAVAAIALPGVLLALVLLARVTTRPATGSGHDTG